MPCIYLNTSILIRALEDEKSKAFLMMCCRRYECVVSSVHDLEKWKHDTLLELKSILGSIGVHKVDVDVDTLRRIATRIVIEHN